MKSRACMASGAEYKCSFCEKTYARSDGLAVHIRRKHGIEQAARVERHGIEVSEDVEEMLGKERHSQISTLQSPARYSSRNSTAVEPQSEQSMLDAGLAEQHGVTPCDDSQTPPIEFQERIRNNDPVLSSAIDSLTDQLLRGWLITVNKSLSQLPSDTDSTSSENASHGQTPNASNSKKRAQSSQQVDTSGGRDRPKSSMENNESEDEEPERPRKRRSQPVPSGDQDEAIGLICPFYYNGPPCYQSIRACSGVNSHHNMDKLRDHITRKHVEDCCPRCQTKVNGRQGLELHQQSGEECVRQNKITDGKLTPGEWETIVTQCKNFTRHKNLGMGQHWVQLYKALFPADIKPLSPYARPVVMWQIYTRAKIKLSNMFPSMSEWQIEEAAECIARGCGD
ncbi:hypothetical protein BDV96DRAFT_329534 [Lophiotrema nucula]|uniref:C2H2-type domain-containing protein n=1 Tax=Lophiotrema nucula TaxID=690887 RepID=A0A6A5YKQ1_9PLEO|nr:hypothetical protein BDV96DRAFT_329534 [Lophiotrema nucula]